MPDPPARLPRHAGSDASSRTSVLVSSPEQRTTTPQAFPPIRWPERRSAICRSGRALFSFPLMTAVQLMCARLGLVTGLGLAGVIRRRYSRWALWGACALLVIANVINIAADLGGMAEATLLVIGAPVALMVPVYGLVMVSLLMWSSYRTIARVFKWLTLVLL